MAQADTIIPPGVQGLDRYVYVNNSPMNFVDPTGHVAQTAEQCDADGWCGDQNSEYTGGDANLDNYNETNSSEEDDYEEYTLTKAQIHELHLYYYNLSDAMWLLSGIGGVVAALGVPIIGVPIRTWDIMDAVAANDIANFLSEAETAAGNGSLTIKLYSNSKDQRP